MIYDGIIRIQNNMNARYLKEMSRTVNYLKRQSEYKALLNKVHNLKKAVAPLYTHSITESFSNAVVLFQRSVNNIDMQSSIESCRYLRCISSNFEGVLQQWIFHVPSFFAEFKHLSEHCLFLRIAEEMGFPIYLEVASELQDKLISCYVRNGHYCNKKEMREIILDYYSDDYIDRILNGIKNVHIFKIERVLLIEEGIETYQLGLYGSSASLFAVQLSGMIRDVFEELSTFYKISKKEKKELLDAFNQNCTPDSEKGMLLQIVNSQSNSIMLWYKVLLYFLKIVYSTKGNDSSKQPNRNMICHGKQMNYNTKEMNLKLIMCMDIISELAWRVINMKAKRQ